MSLVIVYARKCDGCNKGMNEGFCLGDGEEYYCSETCLHKHYDKDEYDDMHKNDFGYWTTWEDFSDLDWWFEQQPDGTLSEVNRG